jgi:hypothetical protein
VKRAFPYAVFLAVTLAVFWKFLLFGQTLTEMSLLESQLGVSRTETIPWFPREHPRHVVADNLLLLVDLLKGYNEGLKAGELRLWNPSLSAGIPAYADPMLHPFYPPQILLHRLFPPGAAYELFLLLHFYFSGLAVYWLLRGLGRSPGAGVAGGLVWMLLGYNALWFSTGILAGASVWGPLTLLFLLWAFDRRQPGFAAAGGIALGLAILGSHPQHALHLLVFTLGWLLVLGWRRGVERPLLLRSAAYLLLLSTGVGLAAILTRLDTIANGFRNPLGDFELLYSAPWTLALHLGDLVAGKATYFENPFFDFEFTVHAGLAAVSLAAVAAVRGWRDRRVRYLAIFALSALAVAFLKPLAAGLRSLPIFQLSPPSRWLFIFGLAASILVGIGWDEVRERPGRIPLLLLPIAGGLCALVLTLFRNGQAVESSIGYALVAASGLLLARTPRAAAVLGVGALLFELLPGFLLANRHADPGLLGRTPRAVQVAQSREREPWRGTGALGNPSSQGTEGPPDPIAIGLDLNFGNNLLTLYGVETISGFEAIMPEAYARYVQAAGGDLAPGGRLSSFGRLGTRLVDALNLKYAFLPVGAVVPPHFRRIEGEFGTIRLYENPAALPRAWLVGRALRATSEEDAETRLKAPGFDPGSSVILETGDPLPETPAPPTGTVRWKSRTSDHLELGVSGASGSFLVLSENDYPGWEATLDGAPVPILRADVTFRAVAVPAGDHAVSFRFRPDSARSGVIGSLAFLLLGVGLVARHVRGKAA